MKALNIFLKGFADAIAVACCMLAAVCALPTSFGIGFSLTPLVLFCAVAALLLSFGMHVPRFGFVFAALFLVGMVLLLALRFALLRDGAVWLLDTVLKEVGNDFTVLQDPSALHALADAVGDPVRSVTAFLAGAAALIGLLASFSLIRGKLLLLPALIPLPLLLLGMVYTDCRPALWTAVLAAIWSGWTLLGHGIRKGDSARAGACFLVLLAALIGLGLLIPAVSPERSYTPISFEERKRMIGDRVERMEDLFLSIFGRNDPRTVDLGDVGDRTEDGTVVFELSASRAGTYLLRTHSYGRYENGKWLAAKEYDGAFRSMEMLGSGGPERTVLSVSGYNSGERLVPYGFIRPGMIPDDVRPGESARYTRRGSTETYVVPDESYVCARGRTSYLWSVASADPGVPRAVTPEERAYIGFIKEQYVMPAGPVKDALAALAYSEGLYRSDPYETALAVADYVRGTGTYTLTPAKAPDGTDFVLFFLTQSREGYCVHFASATAAILQALDIPARYTVGYCAAVPEAGTWIGIPERSGHAWAEVYAEGVGWLPIESTGGFRTDPLHPEAPSAATPAPHVVTTSGPTLAPSTPEPVYPATEAPETPTPAPPTPEPTAIVTPSPGQTLPNGSGANGGTRDAERSGAAWLLLLIPLVPAAWLGIGILKRRRREMLFRDRNVRRSIPEMAAYLKSLECFGAKKDPDADAWAEEAAFSDHEMRNEHRILLKRVRAAQNALYKNAPVRRFFCRWVLFII